IGPARERLPPRLYKGMVGRVSRSGVNPEPTVIVRIKRERDAMLRGLVRVCRLSCLSKYQKPCFLWFSKTGVVHVVLFYFLKFAFRSVLRWSAHCVYSVRLASRYR